MTKFIIFLCLFVCTSAFSQEIVFKTNTLYWAALTPNVGVEVGLSDKTTLELNGMMNLFVLNDNKKINFLAVQPEYRYWFCQSFIQHFVGLHLHYANYNAGLKQYRYNGNLFGAGVSYGYDWYLSPRWNLEATLGIGYAYMDHEVYDRPKCGAFKGLENRHYFGLTKIGVSIIYFLK